jgi:succinate dehydrogenase/fumarate reductase flavoprotein subunit
MKKDMISRRDFLKNTSKAAGGAVLAGSVFAAGCATTAGTAPAAGIGGSWDKEVDILVLGGGVGGIFASYAAVKGGAKTLMAEAGAEIGGTALISSGSLHSGSASTVESIPTVLPTADPEIARAYIQEWIPFRDHWVADTGAPVSLSGNFLSFGGADYEARKKFFQFYDKELRDLGAEIMLKTRGVKLFADAKGSINGALLITSDGTEFRIGARAVILATGGWTNNRAMRAAYWGPWADRCTNRCVPYNLGDGLQMALEHGAQITGGFGFFYGHVEAWPPLVPEDPEKFEAFDKGLARDLLATIQNFSSRGLFINYEGRRFCDENSAPELAGRFCEAILRQTRGHVFLVLDAADIATFGPGVTLLKNHGLVFDEADSIEALADKLAARGVNRGNFLGTIRNYKSTPTTELEIPKTGRNLTTLSSAPFIAMQITAAPSASFGGVKIDTKGRVLNRGEKPIGGLYATACCAGGFFYNEYGGSLGASAVFGKICAETALATFA